MDIFARATIGLPTSKAEEELVQARIVGDTVKDTIFNDKKRRY